MKWTALGFYCLLAILAILGTIGYGVVHFIGVGPLPLSDAVVGELVVGYILIGILTTIITSWVGVMLYFVSSGLGSVLQSIADS